MTKAAELAKMGEVLTNSQIGGRRNIIINGAMQVAQRATSSTSTGYATVDRIKVNTTNLDQLAFTQSQSSTVPSGEGFSNSFKFEVTTQETALSSDEFANIQYRMEAQDLQSLAYGTSDAKKTTLSFWVRSSLTGKYSVLFYLTDDTRSNTQSFTISSADTWEHKTITIDGDTTGVIDNDNGAGLNINFILAAGSDYAGTPHSGWGAYAETDDFAFSDQVNFIAQTGTFYLTGLQFELGSQATPFEHRSFGEELQLCKRYFHKTGGTAYCNIGTVTNYTSGAMLGPYKHPVEMRSAPSVTKSGDWAVLGGDTTVNQTAVSSDSNGKVSEIGFSGGSGGTSGRSATLRFSNDANAYLHWDSEL